MRGSLLVRKLFTQVLRFSEVKIFRSIRYVIVRHDLGPLHMSPVDRAAFLPRSRLTPISFVIIAMC